MSWTVNAGNLRKDGQLFGGEGGKASHLQEMPHKGHEGAGGVFSLPP